MSDKIKFVKGDYQLFRVTTDVHLGRLERYLVKVELVEFDGHSLKFEGAEHSLPQLRGAVLAGWLVPSSDTTTVYKAKSAGIKIRPAQAANMEDRGKPMKVARDEDNRIVGRAVATPVSETAGTEGDDGQTVAKISTPARQRTKITDTSAAQSEINRLDNTPPPMVKKIATGDVEEAIVGETLEDILPEAVSSSTPTPTSKTTKTTKTASTTKVVKLSNGIEWDMGRHWRTRGRDATRTYGGDAETLDLIREVEVPSVTNMIDDRMAQS